MIHWPSNGPSVRPLLPPPPPPHRGRSSSQRTLGGGHTPAAKADMPPPPPQGGGRTSGRARAEGEEAEGTPPPPSGSGAEQAHVPSGAHGGAAWARGNGMLIAQSTEALAWARAHLQEGTGSSPFAGESEAERALSKRAGPQTHAGLPL